MNTRLEREARRPLTPRCGEPRGDPPVTQRDAPATSDVLAALLRGEPTRWGDPGPPGRALFHECVREQVAGLVYERLTREPNCCDWAPDVQQELARHARTIAAKEFVRQQELVIAFDRLAFAGVHPILFKGTALAYTAYAVPSSRPRGDTDLLIHRDAVDAVLEVMKALGYTRAVQTDGELLACQFCMERRDRHVNHAFDFHWKISTQVVFADLLTYAELSADAVAVSSLGPQARAAGPLHSLLIACIHPVMHHGNIERLLWLYDIHLLAQALSDADWNRFAEVAIAKQVAAVSASGLGRARARLGTPVPDPVIERLASVGSAEPSSAYLRPDRRWSDDVVSSLKSLPRWGDRLRLLRETAFPGSRYMLAAYGLPSSAVPLLPVLYGHRILLGLWNIATGRK